MMAKEPIRQYGLYFLWFLCCLELAQCNGILLTVAQTMDLLAIFSSVQSADCMWCVNGIDIFK